MAIFLNKGKNYLINGGMDFWQRSTSSNMTNGYIGPDRWRFYDFGSATLTVARSTDVPTIAQSGYKFNFSSLITVTTAQASLTGTDGVRIIQNIEGNIFEPLAGKEQTLSFWIKTSRTGNYAVSFSNGSGDRCFVSIITVNQANTWEKKSVSFSHNTLGTWNYDTSIGLSVCLSLADSSTYQSPILNNWISGSFFSHSSCVNFVSTVGSTLYLTGFQLEEGNSATNYSLAGGLIPQELQLCQRYYEKSYPLDIMPGESSTLAGSMQLKVQDSSVLTRLMPSGGCDFLTIKRIPPTNRVYGIVSSTPDRVSLYNTPVSLLTVTSISTGGANTFMPFLTTSSNASASTIYACHWTADAEL